MGITHIPFPLLPAPPSWFPGHMMKFTRMLPALLSRTDVVLELRDSRLPLTSINTQLEAHLRRWRAERGWHPTDPTNRSNVACEHIVILNKRDLVPEWGMRPFQRAMQTKFPNQRMLFASWNRPRDIRDLNKLLVSIANEHPHAMELNVLVIGMPNVGKSTLLNALRHMGIKGPTSKAFQTSAHPGMTQALSTRLKLSLSPLIYAFDSPGVMLPFLGRGDEGAERGVKLALIAGIKEGMYDTDALAAYLLYRMNRLNPISPAYMPLLPDGAGPTVELEEFLSLVAQRMYMLKRGGIPDLARAAVHFVKWWRAEGGLASAGGASVANLSDAFGLKNEQDSDSSSILDLRTDSNSDCSAPPAVEAWGFDFQWPSDHSASSPYGPSSTFIQQQMEKCIDDHMAALSLEDAVANNVSVTQERKSEKAAEALKRGLKKKSKALAKASR